VDVSVVVGTFGDHRWVNLAEQRAIPSVQGAPVIHRHGETLAQARNEGLALVDTEFVIHLDADDQLDENYITEMAKGTADLRAPSRLDIRGNVPMWPAYMPRVWAHEHQCVGECLRYGNWMTIGTAVRTELARSVGGWEEFGWSEDYALFARCWKAGGTVEACPDAIYRAWWTRGSRNRISHAKGLYWHREIEKAVWPEEPSVL
jgi:glycosyltransferase involved in cell wall biosynthesis